jgi:signal transduction histidine kinase
MSIRYKILSLFVLAVLLPVLLLSVVLISISRGAILESIFQQQQETALRATERIRNQVELHKNLLENILKITDGLPRARQIEAARELVSRNNISFSEISLLNDRGQELWKISRKGLVKDLVDRSRRGEFRFARQGGLFISSMQFSTEREPFIIISVANPAHRERNIIVAKITLDDIWKWVSEIKVGETGQAFIVDYKGNLIAHPEPERVWAHSNFSNLPVVRDFMAHLDKPQPSDERWSKYRDERGEKVVAWYRSLSPLINWAVITQIPEKEVYYPIHRMYRNIFFWTAFWTCVFLFVGFQLVQRITNPLSLLKSGVAQISQGKLDIKLDIRTGDEIEDLAKNFEKMATALKELESLRQDLTRMIIHDLKSPLSGIMGSLDYLESGMLGDVTDEQKKIISLAKKSSESLLVMIQNLLDVAKMEEGKLELRKIKFDLAQLITERKHAYEALATNEGKIITVDMAPGVPHVVAEQHLIERVINNLLTNAVNHTSSGGKIILRLKKPNDNFVEVSVADNGVGIPPEYRDKIFEKFVQVERKQAHLRTGAGLGLTFCKMVIETHGGNIRVESELNKGSAFIFTLPL